MLIEFNVSNFRALKNQASLSLVAESYEEMRDRNVFSVSDKLDVLASAAIYGPNASGKSSLLMAMGCMQSIVVGTRQRGDLLGITPYLLDDDCANRPTEFEVTFIMDGVQYQYGFSATSERIYDEWLFAYPKGRSQRWITREWNPETGKYEASFGDKIVGQKSTWLESTRDNALILSTAVELNSSQLSPVFDWFKSNLRIFGPDDAYPAFTASLFEERETKDKLMKLIKAADFNIHDVKVEKKKFDPDELPDEMPEFIKEGIKNQLKDKEMTSLRTSHRKLNGESVLFDFDDESDGTRKFFGLLGPWLDILERGTVVFVDELHGSLHPLLVRFLVEMFHNPKINKSGAQLIFTTHDTAILSQQVFRRDQIWFTEKKKEGGSKFFPLTDFSPRKGTEDIRSYYLEGRYGALPFFQDVYSAFEAGNGN